VERRTGPWRCHLSAGIRRCDRERLHLSRATHRSRSCSST
jgi:hypothetical protein